MRVLIALLLTSAACGSDADSCGFEDSTFLASYERLNGDCPMPELKLVMPGTVPSGCTQSIDYNRDCGVTYSRECTLEGDTVTGLWKLTPRGSGYDGNAQLVGTFRDGGGCSSLYRVTLVAQ